MIVTVFRSRLMPGVREEYVSLVDRMVELASDMPGYISHKGFFAEDGERVTIVEFESEEAQRASREIYYQDYSVQVCQVLRETSFKREAAP